MTPETPCPECSGAGFFGDNGPVVERLCGFCKGTGVLVEGSAYRHLPSNYRKPVQSEKEWREIFNTIEEWRMRNGTE